MGSSCRLTDKTKPARDISLRIPCGGNIDSRFFASYRYIVYREMGKLEVGNMLDQEDDNV